jgi:Uma2 family endonuclease
MSVTFAQPRKVWTEAEIQALPNDGYIHQVVDGELVIGPKNNFQHEDIRAELLTALRTYAKAHRLGAVLGSNFGCWMENRNCRAPDISFISKARLLSMGFTPSTRKFLPGAPDLAVEILSPSNSRSEIDHRLKDFFASGTQISWIINPDDERCRDLPLADRPKPAWLRSHVGRRTSAAGLPIPNRRPVQRVGLVAMILPM